MSDPPCRFPQPSFLGASFTRPINCVFRVLWVVESMWVIVVPAVCALSSVTVYRQTKSPFYSLLSTVCCGVIWLTSRYFILGRVPIFLSPRFKECLTVVRLLLHNINTKLIKKYAYRYPLIVNLGVLTRYNMTRIFHPISDTVIDKQLVDKLSRYMDFAAASYGVFFYPKHAKSSFLRFFRSSSIESYSIGSFATTVSVNVISQMTGVSVDSIIVTQLKGESPLRPGYYICIDDTTRSVVLVIRGTLTLSDALTDISCLSKEFAGGWAHHGISVGAEAIFTETKVILENLLQQTGYSLVLCGHSLGAGTAVLLTLYILDKQQTLSTSLRNCDVTCYAYAPPPVFNDRGQCKEKWADKIITVINGTDIIPRASLANMFCLLMQLQYIEKLSLSFWERCSVIVDKKTEHLEDLMMGMEDFMQAHIKSSSEVFRPLYHVGKILWIDRHTTTATQPKNNNNNQPSGPEDTVTGEPQCTKNRATPYDENVLSCDMLLPNIVTSSSHNITPTSGHPTSGHPTSGHPTSGHPTSGHPTSGHPTSGHPTSGHPISGHPTDSEHCLTELTKPVLLKEEPYEWQRIYIGHRFIADHWPHEYQKTLKLFLESS